MRFSATGFLFGEEVGGYADGCGEFVDFLQCFHLLSVLGYDPFPAIHVREVVALAEMIQHFFTLDTELCFQAVMAVIETCMDDLTVGVNMVNIKMRWF